MSEAFDDGAKARAHGGIKANGTAPPQESLVVVSLNARELKIFVIAGEHSGDVLGGKLMATLNGRRKGQMHFLGVGGPYMTTQGLVSQFPIDDVAVMGSAAIARRLPHIVRRVYQTVDAAIAAQPDAVIIIGSARFTHPIAKRIRKRNAAIPIINYISPNVWALRPGQARRMRRYIDHVLGLLPFEPGALADLGGPPCSYVGHPLIERARWIASLDPGLLAKRLKLTTARPVLVVLPGSRQAEVSKLMTPFGLTVAKLLHQARHPPQIIMPVDSSLRRLVEEQLRDWPLRPHLVETEEDKFRAFELADAALAASGPMTLELAVTGTPMVVGYRAETNMLLPLRLTNNAKPVMLANQVLGENAFPEFLDKDCVPEKLAPAIADLLTDGAARRQQIKALASVRSRLALAQGSPSEAAADIVLRYADHGRDGAGPEQPHQTS